jgi:hypothetical protein
MQSPNDHIKLVSRCHTKLTGVVPKWHFFSFGMEYDQRGSQYLMFNYKTK